MLDRELEQVTERAEGRKGFVRRPWWRPPMDLDGWMTAQGARPIADFNGGKEREKKAKVKGKAVKKWHLATWPAAAAAAICQTPSAEDYREAFRVWTVFSS